MTVDPHCFECKAKFPDPKPEELVMFLHAWSYAGPDWKFTTDLPAWAKENWVDSPLIWTVNILFIVTLWITVRLLRTLQQNCVPPPLYLPLWRLVNPTVWCLVISSTETLLQCRGYTIRARSTHSGGTWALACHRLPITNYLCFLVQAEIVCKLLVTLSMG